MGGAPHRPRGLQLVLVHVLVLVVCEAATTDGTPRDAAPDPAKINISLSEYESTMVSFLDLRRKHASDYEDIPELVTFDVDKEAWHTHPGESARLKYKVVVSDDFADVESSSLRVLLPPQPDYNPTVIKVRVNEILELHRRRFVDEKTIYLSNNATKWCDFDVSNAVRSWIRGQPNSGLELVCLDCVNDLHPYQSAITSAIHRKSRVRRQVFDSTRQTDCEKNSGKKRKCCRHDMKVNLIKLPFPEMKSVVEPKTYEAGYCHGMCPPDFHPGTNHSRIQGFVRQMNNRNGKKKIPKACCTPSKLGPLDIVSISRDNHSKLTVQTWDNMKVIECACS